MEPINNSNNKPEAKDQTPDQVEIKVFFKRATEEINELLRKQWRNTFIAAAVTIFVVVVIYFLGGVLLRTPPIDTTQTLNKLQQSNLDLANIAKSLASQSSTLTGTTQLSATQVVDVINKQIALHEESISQLSRSQSQLSPEAQLILQVFGGAVIAVLLGILGLQRLQNIDAEINAVRNSVFDQAEARFELIQKGFQDIRKALPLDIAKDVKKQTDSLRDELLESVTSVKTIEENVKDLFKKALESMELNTQIVQSSIESLDKITKPSKNLEIQSSWDIDLEKIQSVRQAQKSAEQFRYQKDEISAKAALNKILELQLPGDSDDYHNAHSEAMRLDDVDLGLKIVELGLERFPGQYDLIGDKVKALGGIGKSQEARQTFEEWRNAKPGEVFRGWRPVIFYADLFKGIELNNEGIENLKQVFVEATKHLPREIKIWAGYAEMLEQQGDIVGAKQAFEMGLKYNPLSQQLNYQLGELLLSQGLVDESLTYLEKALKTDYQDQFQPDVNQTAVQCTLAMAYEAADKTDKAKRFYENVVSNTALVSPMVRYAKGRLEVIRLLEGGPLPENPAEEKDLDIQNLLKTLMSKNPDDPDDKDSSD